VFRGSSNNLLYFSGNAAISVAVNASFACRDEVFCPAQVWVAW